MGRHSSKFNDRWLYRPKGKANIMQGIVGAAATFSSSSSAEQSRAAAGSTQQSAVEFSPEPPHGASTALASTQSTELPAFVVQDFAKLNDSLMLLMTKQAALEEKLDKYNKNTDADAQRGANMNGNGVRAQHKETQEQPRSFTTMPAPRSVRSINDGAARDAIHGYQQLTFEVQTQNPPPSVNTISPARLQTAQWSAKVADDDDVYLSFQDTRGASFARGAHGGAAIPQRSLVPGVQSASSQVAGHLASRGLFHHEAQVEGALIYDIAEPPAASGFSRMW